MESSHSSIKMTAAEVSYLWATYLSDSLSICVFKYFLENVDDPGIKSLIDHAIDLSQQHIEMIENMFTEEDIKIPQGFTDQDENLKAGSLFKIHKEYGVRRFSRLWEDAS